MSVMVPWRRKGELPEKGKVRSRDVLGDQQRRRKLRVLVGVLLVTTLLCTGVAIALIMQDGCTKNDVLWSQSGASLIWAAGGEYLLQVGANMEVWGFQGRKYVLESEAQQAVLTSHGVIVSDGFHVVLETPSGREQLLSIAQGGFLVAKAFDDCIYVANPTGGGLYGEPWHVVAATISGETEWQVTVPAVPVTVEQLGTRALIAATDVATGGEACLYCIDTESGRRLWSENLGLGMWRGLVLNGETVISVLDNRVKGLSSSDGKALWTLEPPGPIVSAANVGGSVVLAWDSPWKPPVDRLVSSGVMLLADDGIVRWRKGVAGRHLRVLPRDKLPWEESSGRGVAVLWENNVMCYRAEDGQEVLKARTQWLPLDFDGSSTVLIKEGNDLRLVSVHER
jgi:outer membrane protein assembly factor BamB